MESNQLLKQVFEACGDSICAHMSLVDALNMSVTGRFGAGLRINAPLIAALVGRHEKVKKLGNFKLSFTDLTMGMLRRVLNRLQNGAEAVVHIDLHNGRVIVDVGSAFNDKDAFLAQAEAVPIEQDSPEDQQIFKHLEICSQDEYDDFNPRHPLPKDRAHRRGDSYFNSDIDMLANEALMGHKFDLQGTGSVLNQDKEEAQSSNSLKDRLLNRTKNNYPGQQLQQAKAKVKARAAAALNADSDEDK